MWNDSSLFRKPNSWRVIQTLALFVILVISVSTISLSANASDSRTRPDHVVVELRAVRNYGNWVAPNETIASVISMITAMRASTGNRSLDLYAIVSGPQDPSEYLLKSTTTLDDFLLQAKHAAGGRIIPELNLNYYTSDLNLELNNRSNYCDPHDPTNCGPSWFFQVSSELLSLKAVSSPHREVNLDAWDQFCRDVVTAGLPPSTPTTVLQELKAQGWTDLIIKSNRYIASDDGNAWAIAAPVVSSNSSPYMQPPVTLFPKLPPGLDVLVHFDRQIASSPRDPTALATFLANLTRGEKVAALKNLASLQGPDNYTFIYPVLTYTMRNSVLYVWDAAIYNQRGGQPFINLIEQLIDQYN